MKKVLAFDIDQTLNIAKTPIPEEIAIILTECLNYFEICPISGQKFDQFLIQIVDRLIEVAEVTPAQLQHLHLFVAQGTQYYRYLPMANGNDGKKYDPKNWELVYNYPLTEEEAELIINAIKQAALGQKAGTEEKYAWDPDCKKREQIVMRAKELAPNFMFEIGGTTSINAVKPGMNKAFGMTHLMKELKVERDDILYFGDMTQPGGNDYPVLEMGIETITVRNHEDTAFALRGILGVL